MSTIEADTIVDEPRNAGRVTFEPNGDGATKVKLVVEWEPEGFVEKAGAALQADDAFAKIDLMKFKTYVENAGHGVDGWHGETRGGA